MKKKDKIQDEVDDEHEGIMHEINNFVGLESAEPQILEVAISKKTKDSTHTNPTESKKKKKHKESEKTKVSLEPTKETEVANEPVQTAPVAIDSHTVTSLTSENQEPPQEITTFTKKKKKEKDETKSEMKKLLQKVEQVEEKLKQREQITVTVCNVTVSKLVRVHKLIRNHPWLKVTYGSSHEWVAEYITPEEEEEESDDVNNNPTDVAAKKKQRKEGSMAEWRGLSWSFTLERNESDRSDLVFAVCSKDLVIGRYTVKREEFKDIPDSNSGYFSISGDITNTLGKVGVIQLICQRAVAQRPLSPVQAKRKATKRLEAEISKEGVVEEKKGGGEEGKEAEEEVMVADDPPKRHLDTWRYQHVSLRVLSVAVMDLKSAHFLEANSPSVVMESGEWMGMTEPLKNAGMAASWQKLQWKIAVDRDSGVSIFVNSHAKMIGKLFLSAEELLTIQPEESRKVLALVKYISHGSDITGKMKLHVIINHPDDIVESPVLNSVMVDGVEKEEVLTGVNVERQFRTVPFNVIIQEIVCLDISFPLMNRLFQRSASVKLQCACNAWTSTTDEIEAKGENAHWINLRWKMPVTTTQTALRSTLWYNKGQGQLGKSLISVTDLQQIPCDRTGRAEIFSKLVNEKGEIVSKLRLTCRFEENLIALQKLAEGSTKSQWESHDDTSLPMNHSMSFDEAVITHSQYSHHSRSRPHSASSPTPPRPFSLDTSLPVPTRLHFPLAGMIQSISVIDLPSVHTLRKNSPQVEFVYDRASIATEVCVNGGAMARWEELLWAIRIRADSRLRFVVKSNQTVIGTAQIDPRQMILLPVNPDGCIEIVSDLFSANKSSGIAVGKVVVSYQVDLESQRRNQFNDVLGVPASPTSALTPVKGGAGTSFDEYSSKHSLANDSMPLPRPASPPLDFSQQQFQPTIVFDPNVLYAAESEKHYSFRISISEIDLWDLKPFHSLSKNCPQLFAVCGRWSGNSTVQTNVSDQCYWSDLQWSFYVVDRTTRLRVRVTSRGKEVGTVFFSLAQLTEAPTDEDLTKRISVPIMSDAQGEIGKMKMTYVMEAMKRNPKSPKPEHIIRDESTSGPSIAYPPTPLMHSAAPPSSSSSSWIVFPCTITLLEVKAFDVLLTSLGGSHEPFGAESVKRAMQLSATSVSFRLHCDDFYQSIEGQVQPNGLIVLRQLSWAIPLQKEDSLITFVILRRGEEVAHVRATAKSLLRDSTIISSEGLRERVLRLQSILNADIGEGGNLHLIFHATNQLPYHPNTTYNTPSHTLPPLLPHGRNPMTSYSPLASPTHHNQHNLEGSVSLPSLFPIHQNLTQPLDVNHSINASQLTLENSVSYQNDTFEGAVRFSIVAIAAVDLPAAHRLKPNSPVCSVACGKFTATTQVSSNSGDTAIWENLKMTFDCKRTSRVRFVVTSGDQLIGSCHFSRGRMLFNGTPAPNGSHVIFGDITNNSGKEVGRIKLMYEVTMPESVTNQ